MAICFHCSWMHLSIQSNAIVTDYPLTLRKPSGSIIHLKAATGLEVYLVRADSISLDS